MANGCVIESDWDYSLQKTVATVAKIAADRADVTVATVGKTAADSADVTNKAGEIHPGTVWSGTVWSTIV